MRKNTHTKSRAVEGRLLWWSFAAFPLLFTTIRTLCFPGREAGDIIYIKSRGKLYSSTAHLHIYAISCHWGDFDSYPAVVARLPLQLCACGESSIM